MMLRRKFLKTASGLIVGFPYIVRSQVFPGAGIFIGVAERQKHPTGGGGGSDTAAVTGQSLGTLRNNFGGGVGFRFSPNSNITVTQVGRWIVSGNNQTHSVNIKNNGGTTLTSANVDTTLGTPGSYLFASCTPQALTSGVFYRIESGENSGGDQWYDNDTTITTTAAITDDGHSVNGAGGGTGNDSYVPPNFKYH